MESGASLTTRNPCLSASPRAKVGLGTVRCPGFQRGMRGARLVANGASGRWSVSVESKLSCDLGEDGVGGRKSALARICGFGDFGATTLAMRAFKKKFFDFENFVRKDHEDGDDEEEENGRHRGGRGSDDDDDEDTSESSSTDEETSSTDEETSSTDEETSSTDEEDTTEDEDERECDD